MRKVMKSTLVIMLTLALILTQVSMVTYADNGKGNSNNNGKGNAVTIQNKVQVSEQAKLELREKLRIMVAIGGGDWDGLPEGMVKKGFLPYGLAKRYQNGSFPYGLAKRIKDFQFGQEKPPVDIEVLKALIVTAKSKYSSADKDVNHYFPTYSLADFLDAINVAEAVATKTAPTSADIKTQIEKLKAAIVKFENSVIKSGSLLNETLAKLIDYKSKYYDNLTRTKQIQLDALILEVTSYANGSKILTLGIYTELLSKAKAFEDPLLALKQYIEKVKGDLYVNPFATTLVFKNNDSSPDLAVIQYLPGSNLALKEAIEDAETFVAGYKDEPVIKITTALATLEIAVKVYEGNKILKGEELVILQAFLNELKEYYNKSDANKTTELDALIKEIEKHFAPTNAYYTVALRAKYFDMAPTYIKGIYDSLRLELKELVDDAKTFYDNNVVTDAYLTDLRIILKQKIDIAAPISTNTASKFTEINSAYSNLSKAMVDFEYALEMFKLKGLVAIAEAENTAATVADKTVDPQKSLYDNLVTALAAAKALIVLAEDADATNNPTVATIKTTFTALETAVTAFTPSPVTP